MCKAQAKPNTVLFLKEELHIRNLEESISVINECVERGWIIERQRTIGFHCSAAAVDILEILLHKHHLISPGAQLKHDWFASENKIKEKLNFEFPHKNEIIPLIMAVEKSRNLLCYGKPQPEKEIEKIVLDFKKLVKIAEEEGMIK